MPQEIFLIVALVIPLLALTILRINAVMVFLSLCLGDVLVRYVASEANSMLTLFAPGAPSVGLSTVHLIILLTPAVLTSIFMVFSVHGRGKQLMNLLPAAGTASLAVLLAVPLLPAGTRNAIQGQPLWMQLSKLQALIIGASAIVGLLFLWAQRRHGHHEER
jgi:hypothetical protein